MYIDCKEMKNNQKSDKKTLHICTKFVVIFRQSNLHHTEFHS